MQSKCLELEVRRRVDGTSMQSKCLEKEERNGLGKKDAEQLLRARREKKS